MSSIEMTPVERLQTVERFQEVLCLCREGCQEFVEKGWENLHFKHVSYVLHAIGIMNEFQSYRLIQDCWRNSVRTDDLELMGDLIEVLEKDLALDWDISDIPVLLKDFLDAMWERLTEEQYQRIAAYPFFQEFEKKCRAFDFETVLEAAEAYDEKYGAYTR